mmetsp:Transcript_16485/g.25448  ORF Transcript_16485/g.25448 Transcript_16485/m.25448 type:complete len:117 (+) Transcript_16485:2009-2359(+)
MRSLPLQSFGIERILKQRKYLIVNPEPESEQIRHGVAFKEEGILSIIKNNISTFGRESPPLDQALGAEGTEHLRTLQAMPSIILEKDNSSSEGGCLPLNDLLHPDRECDSLSDSSH